ncbi:tetratricopeptide (TPR) repeat protein [Saccharothrix tamanrassetensis]|uniref:Tetratricopeptide (TPR) repeat protein n=1 Tax=Saccharothrix tamanrassetensis TaxID=1051531 RepID=A0A841CSC1_9PSEU|nr:TIR domain-containing protein [Saccharothrix tamanrassetensis]MBB5960199.1 tetratricopeptide (TPR) repeat protein [Saccharothrix tamanrassetensis]
MTSGRPDVFLSYTWSDTDLVDRIEDALVSAGVSVFRDVANPSFDAISANLARQLDAGSLFLAVYSARYPTRYACQWELTRAFLAAQRHGDPRDRILVVNPEPDESHIVPVELEDAGYLSAGPGQTSQALHISQGSDASQATEIDLDLLVLRVRERLRDIHVPLGYGAPGSTVHLPRQVLAPRRFVGRYPALWHIHTLLHTKDVRAIRPPTPCSSAVIRGFTGTGKTWLAERYALLFQQAYPGGVHWIDLAGVDRADVVAESTRQLRAIAADELGLEVEGVPGDRLKALVARHFTTRGQDVLWVVDDLPRGLGKDVLHGLLPASPRAYVLCTTQEAGADWQVPVLEPHGLTPFEGQELFAFEWKDLDQADRDAITALVDRCGGHPYVLAASAVDLRNSQGLANARRATDSADSAATSVVGVLRSRVREVGDAARLVLGVAAALSAAPFEAGLLARVLGVTNNDTHHSALDAKLDERAIASALDELDDAGLAHRLDRADTRRTRQTWRVHQLVVEAVRRESPADELNLLTRRVSEVLVALLATDCPPHTYQHARSVARSEAVRREVRVELLRAVTRASEQEGDLLGAHEAATELLRIKHMLDVQGVDDVILAARAALNAGDYTAALERAQTAIRLSGEDGNFPAHYRSRLLAAQAFEHLGDYPAADEVFYGRRDIQVHGDVPAWMPAEERGLVLIARAAGLRLRGEYAPALAVINRLLPDLPHELRTTGVRGAWPRAMIELTQLRLRRGEAGKARKAAGEVADAFRAAGMVEHPLHLQAVAFRAEAELQVALTDIGSRNQVWERSAQRIGELRADYERRYGPDSPLTLNLLVMEGKAIVSRGRPRQALELLAEVGARVARVLGEDHPLHYRVRHATAQCHGQLDDHERQGAILEDLLPRQVAALGRTHPDSLATRLDLGLCHVMTDRIAEGNRMMSEASRELRALGWSEPALAAWLSLIFSNLPAPAWKFLLWSEKFIPPRRKR